MEGRRIERLNSLLKEVISDVIAKEVKDPRLIGKLLTVTSVEITKDLHMAKVYISVIGTDADKKQVLEALTSASGFIGVNSAQKIVIRFFPVLTFKIDTSAEKHQRIDDLLSQIHKNDKLEKP